MRQQELMVEVKSWIEEAATQIKEKLKKPILIEEKTSRHDLVTNVDKETEQFLVSKIRKFYPDDQILGEEGLGDKLTDTKGRIWIIDPIDGTLNFIKQQENFCIMIGIFEDNVPKMGFIYDVMKDEFMYGGEETGVYLNGKQLPPVPNLSLEEGLIGANSVMFAKNILNTQTICFSAVGLRILGCAGIDFLSVLRGTQNAYISNLAPWDFAAGVALGHALGLKASNLNGEPFDILGGRQYFVIATQKTYDKIFNS